MRAGAHVAARPGQRAFAARLALPRFAASSGRRIVAHRKAGKSLLGYAALVMVPPAWLSTITGVSNQLISGSEP